MPWYIPEMPPRLIWRQNWTVPYTARLKQKTVLPYSGGKSLEKRLHFLCQRRLPVGYRGIWHLNAILYELKDYAVTPVVNAQTVSIINYPVLAFEQEDAMDADYSRNTASVLENVIWPDISTLSEYLNSRFTFLFTPQFHYQDEHEPVSQELEYFSACYMKNS